MAKGTLPGSRRAGARSAYGFEFRLKRIANYIRNGGVLTEAQIKELVPDLRQLEANVRGAPPNPRINPTFIQPLLSESKGLAPGRHSGPMPESLPIHGPETIGTTGTPARLAGYNPGLIGEKLVK